MTKSVTILLVEDDRVDAMAVKRALRDLRVTNQQIISAAGEESPGHMRFEIEDVNCLSLALKRLEAGGVDVILLDLGLPDSQGLDTFTALHVAAEKIPIVVLTRLMDEGMGMRAVQEGAQDFLIKGKVDSELLARSLRYAIERKKKEQEIKDKNLQLELANKMKSELMSIVSHDFGNPLGTTEMMSLGLYGELSPKMKEKLEVIQKTAGRLNRLRLDTLELTKIELGHLELKREDTELLSLLKTVVEGIIQLAQEKDQHITVNIPQGVYVSIDRNRLFQVVENYLSNAIRYTPEGGNIELGVEEAEHEVVISVSDTGRGIVAKELENIFLPFYRTGTRVSGSTGLGLSIVKGIVEAHKGRCWAQSEGEEKGATFYFTLPKIQSQEERKETLDHAVNREHRKGGSI